MYVHEDGKGGASGLHALEKVKIIKGSKFSGPHQTLSHSAPSQRC